MRYAVAIAALVLLAGCTYTRNPSGEEATVVRPGNFIAGPGTIVAISVLRNQGRAGSSDPNLYRISVQMEDKGFQTVDTDSYEFFVGQTVNITNDGRIERVTGTTFNR